MSKKTRTAFRDCSTGKFVTERAAGRRSGKVVRERIPAPGRGTAKSIEKADRTYDRVLERLAKR